MAACPLLRPNPEFLVNSSMDDVVPLSILRSGQRARVDLVVGQPEHVHRLEELGLRPGAEVEMIQSGSPCIIRLGGGKLCFRADEATSVFVREGDGA